MSVFVAEVVRLGAYPARRVAALASVPRIGSLHDDLVRLLTGWKPTAQQVVVDQLLTTVVRT